MAYFCIYERIESKTITKSLFADIESCAEFAKITIPENVQQIGGAAFIDCKAINKITINAIKCIKMCSDNNRPAFVGAPITTVEFGPFATTIPDYAFYGCKTLTSVILVTPNLV